MSPRESALLTAAAQLLGANRDTTYGPARAVRDALALETEVAQQTATRYGRGVFGDEAPVAELRKAGAL